MAYDYMANIFYTNNDNVYIEEDGIKREETVTDQGPVTNEYIGYLNIPKINLTKGFLQRYTHVHSMGMVPVCFSLPVNSESFPIQWKFPVHGFGFRCPPASAPDKR